MTVLPDRSGEDLEALARNRRQPGDAGQIPIGIGHLGMANIGRKRGHGVVDIGAVIVPELDTPTDEGVAQIMDSRLAIGTACSPAEFATELLEDAVDGPLREPAPRDDKNKKAVALMLP